MAMLNLRLADGIQRESFKRNTGFDPFELFAEVIRPHVDTGLLVADSERIALTRQGRLVADAIIADFLRPHGLVQRDLNALH
jgi:coproporphyrinogen III oxidase-like Fe-S oxidoreductase